MDGGSRESCLSLLLPVTRAIGQVQTPAILVELRTVSYSCEKLAPDTRSNDRRLRRNRFDHGDSFALCFYWRGAGRTSRLLMDPREKRGRMACRVLDEYGQRPVLPGRRVGQSSDRFRLGKALGRLRGLRLITAGSLRSTNLPASGNRAKAAEPCRRDAT